MTSSKKQRIGVLVGSLRRRSFSRVLASALVARTPAEFECEFIEIAEAVRKFLLDLP